jgi:predicted N-acyltransferase
VTEQLRIEDDVERLPAADWQRLMCGRPALRLEVLKAIAATASSALSLRIFMLLDPTGIAAAAVCECITAQEPFSALDGLLYGRAQRLAAALGASTRPALLFCTPVGTECPVVLRTADPTERRRILDRLLDEIEAHAAGQKLGIGFINVFADEELLGNALRARAFMVTEIQPVARLQIQWHDFDGYLKHLHRRSRNAAQNARHERKRNRGSGVSIRQIEGTAANAAALDALVRPHYRHKNGTDLHFGPEFLPLVSELLGDDFLLFEAVRDGHAVGMMGLVRSGSAAWGAWFGIKLTDRRNDFTYANLVYYHLAESAASLGIKTVLYGSLALDTKRRRGCHIIRSRLFYRPHQPLARLLARAYFGVHRAWFGRKLG